MIQKTRLSTLHSMNVKTALRVGVTATLITLVFTQVDFSALPGALGALDPVHAVTALAILLCVRMLMAARMVMVAREFDVTLSYTDSVAMVFSSSLAGFVLPGGVGTDVVRGLQLSSMYNDPQFAAASVIVDRFLGVLSILIVGAFALQFVELPFPWFFDAFVYLCLAGGIGVVLFGQTLCERVPVSLREPASENQTSTPLRLLAKALGFVEQVLAALQHSKNMFGLMSISLAIQVCRCLVFLFTFYAFNLAVPIATVFALVPVLFIIVIAPISVGGLGVRESLLALLLVPQGYPLESLILVGFASHLLELIASLPGAIFLLRGFKPQNGNAQT